MGQFRLCFVLLLCAFTTGAELTSDPPTHQHQQKDAVESLQKRALLDSILEALKNEHFLFYRGIDSRFQTWILSILAACVIGLSGVVPLIIIPVETGLKLNQEQGGAKYLRLLLSFAVGGLLGDVFLHLLPEAWNHIENVGPGLHSNHLVLGLWVLLGMFSFVILEIIFTAFLDNKKGVDAVCSGPPLTDAAYMEKASLLHITKENISVCDLKKNGIHLNGTATCDMRVKKCSEVEENKRPVQDIHVTGYLNLMANGIDNFSHGLAVAASFIVGVKMGMLTTFAILIHEIPHEIGDFAILLKSGFHPWDAAKAQLSTATIGILGVVVALSAESTSDIGICTSWILPFTSGGFLNIALVNVLPDLLKEKDPWESMKQMMCICGGIAVMGLVSVLVE